MLVKALWDLGFDSWLNCCAGVAGLFLVWIAVELLWAQIRRAAGWTNYPPLPLENGKMVGYKLLHWNEVNECWESAFYCGPIGYWGGGWIRADVEPTPENTNGIYVCKDYNDPFLRWGGPWSGNKIFIVAMEEPIVEHERGYRAAGARIIREA